MKRESNTHQRPFDVFAPYIICEPQSVVKWVCVVCSEQGSALNFFIILNNQLKTRQKINKQLNKLYLSGTIWQLNLCILKFEFKKHVLCSKKYVLIYFLHHLVSLFLSMKEANYHSYY